MGSGLWLACGGADGAGALDNATADGGPEGGNADTGGKGNDATAPPGDGASQTEAGGGDGGNNPEAGPGGTTTIITCGSTTCAIPAEACCERGPSSERRNRHHQRS